MDEMIRALEERNAAIEAACLGFINLARQQERDLTGDEKAEVDKLLAEAKSNEEKLKTYNETKAFTLRMAAGKGRQTEPDRDGSQLNPGTGDGNQQLSVVSSGKLPATPKDGRGGFKHIGELCLSVLISEKTKGQEHDPRLKLLAPSVSMNEGAGEAGGFLVPPDFRQEIYDKVMGIESLLPLCDELTTTGNSVSMPADEAAPWATDGIRTYWTNEGGTMTPTKPKLSQFSMKLEKITALVPVTEEMLDDASSLGNFIRRKTPEVMTYSINDSLLFGDGVGKPLGLFNGDALVTVAKESGQTADTIVAKNLSNMWARMYAPCRRNAVWIYNQDLEAQFPYLFGATGTNSGELMYMPPGGLSTTPYATLKGRPMIPLPNMKALGDKGDIALVDMKKYATLLKSGQGRITRQDFSIHLYFDSNHVAFRFQLRLNGKPWWNGPINMPNGNSLSCFVTLEERA